MGKNNTETRKTLVQRVDHHEKILILFSDRLNHRVDPELKMLAGAIQECRKAIADNKEDIDALVDYLDRGFFGRLWDRLFKKEEANDDMAVGEPEAAQPSGGEAGGGEAGHPSGAVQEAGGKEEERVVHGDAGSRSQDGTPAQDGHRHGDERA